MLQWLFTNRHQTENHVVLCSKNYVFLALYSYHFVEFVSCLFSLTKYSLLVTTITG
jgi:hypothetical protein